jgi:hypothetical protein
MKSLKIVLISVIILIFLAGCQQSDPVPTAPPVENLPEATAAPTNPPATPEISEPETYPAQVVSYNLGDTTIIQDHFPEDSRFYNMPVRLEGVIGVPESDEAHPVVLILHGSHTLCDSEDVWPCAEDVEQKNYEGFTYLVEALAEAGYVALAINVNAEHTFAYGEAPPSIRTKQLIDLHLGELAAANAGDSDKFGVDVNGSADLSNMVWIGHSRGGDFANWIIRDQQLDQTSHEQGYGPIQGMMLLAPAIFTTDALPAVDLPTTLILPTCDADVQNQGGQSLYESARFDPERTELFTSVYLENGNHNNFNTVLDPDPLIENRPDCAEEMVLAAADQQDFVVQYAVDFLQTVYGENGAIDAKLGLDPTQSPPTDLYNFPAQITTLYPSANRLTVIQPQSDTELSQNLLGGAVTATDVTTLFCDEGYYVPDNNPGSEGCKRVNFNQPGFPQQLVLSWEAMGAEWRTAVPEAYADLTDYTTIQLRAALDPLSPLNAPDEPQSFTLEFSDSSGNREQLLVSPIDFPVGETIPNDYFEGGTFTGQVYMNSFRIPLGELTAVDLTNITEIALIFDQTPSGTLFLADLELIK